MAYTKQTWIDKDPTTPVSASRLGHLETQYDQAVAYGDGAYIRKPPTATLNLFVSTGGDDANDGLTVATAKKTIAAAVAAAGASIPHITIGVGTFTDSVSVNYPNGAAFIGQGAGLTSLVYTGTGNAFESATPTVRTYSPTFRGFALAGPGKTSTAVGIGLGSVSLASIQDVQVRLFGTAFSIYSSIGGGAVYDNFMNVSASSCTVGFGIRASGSNSTRFFGCRANACTTGVDIVDSNNTSWSAGQIEACTTGISVAASAAALSDKNMFLMTRFEGNTTAWTVTSTNVRDTQILQPQTFGTYTFVDSGTRTTHIGNIPGPNKWSTALADSTGSFQFERSVNGGSETPLFVVRDVVTTSGTPVTHQAETERAAGFFYRGKRGGTTYFDVRADGLITGGSSTTAGRPATPARVGAQWFDTTLNKPIWWDGAGWRDATGTTV